MGIMGLSGIDYQDAVTTTDWLDWDGVIDDTEVASVNSSSSTGRITGAKAFKIPNNDLWILFYRNSSRQPVARVCEFNPTTGAFGTLGTAKTISTTERMVFGCYQADADNKFVLYMQGAGVNEVCAISVDTGTKAVTVGTIVTITGSQNGSGFVQFSTTIYAQLYTNGTALNYYLWTLSGTTFTAQTSAGTVSGVTFTTTNADISAISGFDSAAALLMEVSTATTFIVKSWNITRSTYTLTGALSQTLAASGAFSDGAISNQDANGDWLSQIPMGYVMASNTGDAADAYIMAGFYTTQTNEGTELKVLVFLWDDSALTFAVQNMDAEIVGATSKTDWHYSSQGMVAQFGHGTAIFGMDIHNNGYFAVAGYSADPDYYISLGKLEDTGKIKMTQARIKLAATATVTSRQEVNLAVDAVNDNLILAAKTNVSESTFFSGVL